MVSNAFGTIFRITTWGESHGRGIGVVIDGCPAGLPLSEEEINRELERRRPGKNPYTSPRKEKDEALIYSGLFEGKTTGAPLSIIIHNHDADPSKYEPIKHLLRPGHANFTYLSKYGTFDYRGGGRSSARETACRVAAGAVAKKILAHSGIDLVAYVKEIGHYAITSPDPSDCVALKRQIYESPVFCPCKEGEERIIEEVSKAKEEGDSLGGIIECVAVNLPVGLGDPVYDKLEALLAKGMMSLPATKGFEIGSGFAATKMRGSEHNDSFMSTGEGRVVTRTNHAGGTLGGISTGMPLLFRVAFKPTSSINKTQETVDLSGEVKPFALPPGSRHDPCVTLRAAPIVEAMAAIVLVDALLMNRSCRL
ncbi:MAG: chorismate synthase [Simkaniaceae bacterium]|nr:chorismate synthase [Simkaniaceae bacterium]